MIGPSQEELGRYRLEVSLHERLVAVVSGDSVSAQFSRDCHAIIEAELAVKVDRQSNYLPIAPLLRLARRIGAENVRTVQSLADPTRQTLYALNVAVREPVRTKRKLRRERMENQLRLEKFGRAVLALDQRGMRRWPALQQAGRKVKLPGCSRRYLEQKFREFEEHIKGRGFISNGAIGMFISNLPPRFGIADLKARKGRTPKSAHNNGA